MFSKVQLQLQPSGLRLKLKTGVGHKEPQSFKMCASEKTHIFLRYF